MGSKTLPTIWGTYMKLVTKYQISAINSCWENATICTPYCGKRFWTHQIPASCLPILLFLLCTFYIHLYMDIFRQKLAYMFNEYTNQQSRQTGSRNLTGPKTLPTIWHTYMKWVTKYQIPVVDSCLEKCDEKCGHKLHICTPYCGKRFWTHQIPASCLPILLFFLCTFNIHLYMDIFRNIFQSNYWRQESDIWSQT
jgi:hypothetical protein